MAPFASCPFEETLNGWEVSELQIGTVRLFDAHSAEHRREHRVLVEEAVVLRIGEQLASLSCGGHRSAEDRPTRPRTVGAPATGRIARGINARFSPELGRRHYDGRVP